jgi:3-oxoacyl-[acyl-carrier-protein] synthase-1
LGFTTRENYLALKSGKTSLCLHDNLWGLPEPVCASLFSESQRKELLTEGLTFFESLAVASVKDALKKTTFDITSQRVAFVLASTKGNIQELEHGGVRVNLAESAQVISQRVGVTTMPIVVCNACISSTSAQVLALRLIESGTYDYVIVNGTDCLNKFVVAGFSSLKAVSPEPCRPFDMDRTGLNLGEASATMVLGRADAEHADTIWNIVCGAVRNDADHISNPSKTAEGCSRAIKTLSCDASELSLVSVHGTATLYNDQMEAVALQRNNLSEVPTLALKGFLGHTMGAAGILETIISLCCIEDGKTLPSKGFEELGVSAKVNISNAPVETKGHTLLKIISGFGGCNAAVMMSKGTSHLSPLTTHLLNVSHKVRLTSDSVTLDGQVVPTQNKGRDMLTELYKKYVGDYPRYYKMDILSKVAFVCSEMLLEAEGNRDGHGEDRAVILFSHTASIASDRAFLRTITDGYYPSPSVFVYTLPNIAAGEIAIRNGYHGETAFYILPQKADDMINMIVEASFGDRGTQSAICGWINCDDENIFEAEVKILKIKD